ncbi:MAG: glycosyltransferase family 2 protein [Solirubrobacteraceae bacterium]
MRQRPVHAVVVAYHAPAALGHCLAGLERQVPVTVVDNSSSVDVATVADRHAAAYVDCGANRGFAAAVNVGLDRLAGEPGDVLLLNPDAVIGPGAVRELVSFLHAPSNARVAAVVPALRGFAGDEQRIVWPFPTPLRMCAEAVGLGRAPARRTFVVGAVLLLRREALEDVGGFDERFFLYAEEADWQRRARARGWTSAVCADAVAEHIGAGTSTDDRRRELLFHAAQETYIRKWYGPVGWWIYRLAACAGAGVRALMLTHARRGEAARRMLLYLRGPCRCAAVEHD